MTATDRGTLTDLETGVLEEISTERLMRHARTLAQWEKVSGTPGERAAVDYLRAELEAIGLATREDRFESLLGWPEEAALDVLDAPPGWDDELRTITHSFTTSTGQGGLVGSLVDAGDGSAERLRQAAGKIALVDGLASPARVLAAGQAGALAVVFVQGDRLHEMCVSPVWGTPTTRTAPLLPALPALSILGRDGARLRQLLAQRPVDLRLHARTFRGWREVPVLTAALPAADDPEHFVLLSAHHCSWYLGAMDNGTADATLLEVARVLAGHPELHRRSLRIAFWPGHTQGRYSGSTWYFDHEWEDLHDNCVLHVNADSTGARGATIYLATGMPQTWRLAEHAIRDAIGAEPDRERQSRAGDQSFWACGTPSIFMDLSQVPAEIAANTGPLFSAPGGPAAHQPGGAPWWWHTPEDTIDKIDAEVLRRDTRVYALATLRALAAPLLPLQPEAAAREIATTLAAYAEAAGSRFDLEPTRQRAEQLVAAAAALAPRLEALRDQEELAADRLRSLNRRLRALDRPLVQLAFTAEPPYEQDLAIPIPPLPLLEPVRRLAGLEPASDEAHFLETELVRRRNRAGELLRQALSAAAAVQVELDAIG